MRTGGPGVDPGPGTKGEELTVSLGRPSLLELLAQAQWPAGSAEGAYKAYKGGGLAGRRTEDGGRGAGPRDKPAPARPALS